MVYPGFEEFKNLSKKGNLVPVFTEVLADIETPVSAFLKLSTPPSFLLESVEGGEKWARYSFLGINPSKVIRGKGNRIDILDSNGGTRTVSSDDPLSVIKEELGRFRPVDLPELPRFCGGFVGYLGYDAVRSFEHIPDLGKKGLDMPDLFFVLADTILVFDSLRQRVKVIVNIFTEGRPLEQCYRDGVARLQEIVSSLRSKNVPPLPAPAGNSSAEDFVSSFSSKESFMSAVEACKNYVVAGDIVQVVISQRFERPCSADPFTIYRALRLINPSPYMYYLDTGQEQIISALLRRSLFALRMIPSS